MVDITNAHKDTNEIFSELNDTATNMAESYTKELDGLIRKISKGIDLYSNSELRDFMARISVETYTLSTIKEQSELKEACATALYKEGMARSFSLTPGSVEARKNQSLLDTLDRQAVSMLYTTVTALLKSKCDEAHRIVAVINGILISRAADAKNSFSPRSEVDQMNFENNTEENI